MQSITQSNRPFLFMLFKKKKRAIGRFKISSSRRASLSPETISLLGILSQRQLIFAGAHE